MQVGEWYVLFHLLLISYQLITILIYSLIYSDHKALQDFQEVPPCDICNKYEASS